MKNSSVSAAAYALPVCGYPVHKDFNFIEIVFQGVSYSRWSLAGEDILLNSHLFLNIQNGGERKRGKKKQIVGKMKKHNALKTQRKTGCQTLQRKEKVMKQKMTLRKEAQLVDSLLCCAICVFLTLVCNNQTLMPNLMSFQLCCACCHVVHSASFLENNL